MICTLASLAAEEPHGKAESFKTSLVSSRWLPMPAMIARFTVGEASMTVAAISTAASTRDTASSEPFRCASRSRISAILRADRARMIAALLPNWLNGVAKLKPASMASSRIEKAAPSFARSSSAASSTRSRVLAFDEPKVLLPASKLYLDINIKTT